MSIYNIHVNRFPVSGKITYTKYHPGKYLVARHPKSSELNEHQSTAIQKPDGTVVLVKQIAGTVARRLICYAKVGNEAKQGDDIGFIRFGSRVDLFLPLNTEICVAMNEQVKGNKTIVARF
jgi:phosphatidylserine decarboxylase